MDHPFRYWRFCAAAGPVFLVAYIVFWGLLGSNIPPLSATLTGPEMAAHFNSHLNQMRTGMVGGMTFSVFYLIWGLGITKVMETLEGNNRVLSVMQMWGAGLTVVPVLMCCVFILGGLYRADTLDPSIIQLMYDLSWITISVCYAVTTMQMIAMGVLFLTDKRATPLMPKWLCWYSIWGGFMFIAENFLPFFKQGAFARNGVLNFWTEYNIYFIYMVLVTFYLFKAITRLEQEYAAGTLVLERDYPVYGVKPHA